MVLLRADMIKELAPLIGEVVMRYAAMEGDFLRLEKIVYHEGSGVPVPEKQLKASFKCKLKPLRDELRAIGQAEAAARLCGELRVLEDMIERRNHLVHGEWVWAFSSDEVLTVKYPRGKNDFADAKPRRWDAPGLQKLIRDIKGANRMINRIAGLFRNGPDGQPISSPRALRGPRKRPEAA
jgi:hypothetical protein